MQNIWQIPSVTQPNSKTVLKAAHPLPGRWSAPVWIVGEHKGATTRVGVHPLSGFFSSLLYNVQAVWEHCIDWKMSVLCGRRSSSKPRQLDEPTHKGATAVRHLADQRMEILETSIGARPEITWQVRSSCCWAVHYEAENKRQEISNQIQGVPKKCPWAILLL